MRSRSFLLTVTAIGALALAGCSSNQGASNPGGTGGSGGGGGAGAGGSTATVVVTVTRTATATASGTGTGTGSQTTTTVATVTVTGTVTTTGGTGGSAGTGGAAGRDAGAAGTGGSAGRDGGAGTGGTAGSGGGAGGSGGAATDGGTPAVNCSASMPSGGSTYTGTNVYGTANGLNYGIWTNGSGGSITVFPSAHAFSASWDQSLDFLAHLGLDFNATKSYTAYGTITAQFAETKQGTAGGFSMIGMYGWTHSPCVEWYINEDSFNGLAPRGSVTATIDGATYYLSTTTTTGTGGANACEAGHTGSWTQMISTRQTAHTCGTVTVSDHFAAWAKQGWSLGTLASVHINVEVGGGTGSIQFPVANVTTTSK